MRGFSITCVLLAGGCTLILGDRPPGAGGSCGKMADVLADDFSDPSLFPERWVVIRGAVAVDGGRLALTVNGSTSEVDSVYAADLRDSSFTIEVDASELMTPQAEPDTVDVELTHTFSRLSDGVPMNAAIDLHVDAGLFSIIVDPGPDPDNAMMLIGGPVTVFSGSYDPVQHRAMRVREDSGVVYFEAAPSVNGPWTTLGDYGKVPGQDTRFTAALAVALIATNNGTLSSAYFSHVNSGGAGSFCPIDEVPSRALGGLDVGGAFTTSVYGSQVSAGPPLQLLPTSSASTDVLASRTRYDLRGRELIVPIEASTMTPPFSYALTIGTTENAASIQYQSAGTVMDLPNTAFVNGSVVNNPMPGNDPTKVTRSFCNDQVTSLARTLRFAEDNGDLVLSYSLDGMSYVDCGRFPFSTAPPLFQPDSLSVEVSMYFASITTRQPGEHVSFF
jgi:hypothetical protein